MNKHSSIDPIWLYCVPLLVMAGQVLIEFLVPGQVLGEVHSEWGPHETMQFAVIASALITAIAASLRVDWKERVWLGVWFVVAGLCCLFVAGEEISWGQHLFYWETSEYWQGVNDQQETNLHNTSSWLDQKPRLILFGGIAAGGLIFPLLQKYKPGLLPARFAMIYPPATLWVVAALVVIPYTIHEIGEAFSMHIFARVSEVQELFMYYFVLLYLWDLRAREVISR